jgi:hypothetical protein
MKGFIRVRHKRNASDERWITPAAFQTLKKEYIQIESQQEEEPQKDPVAMGVGDEVKQRAKPGPKPKLQTNEA